MEYKVFKLVDGQYVEHLVNGEPPRPVLARNADGVESVSVLTLSFSAYQTLIVPVAGAGVQQTTPAPPPMNTTAAPKPPPVTAAPLRAETLPARPTPPPTPPSRKIDLALVVGVALGGVVLLSCCALAVHMYRARSQERRRPLGSKASQLRGTLTESLLSGGAVIETSDSSEPTHSQDTTPPSSDRMKLTKAQMAALRPPPLEPSALVIQGDLIMGDGSNPPSNAPSDIDREEVEERILAGGGTLFRPVLDSDHVTLQADLMMLDTSESPAPSYTPSMDDLFDDEDVRAPGQVTSGCMTTTNPSDHLRP